MDTLLYISAGASVGFAVGLTGIGGGSLMTPLLLLFGFPTHIAIGTDLLYAALTKVSGVWVHHRQNSVNWRLVKLLCMGSIPATVATIFLLKYLFTGSDHYSPILTTCLGFMLTLTALVLIFSNKLKKMQFYNTKMLSGNRLKYFTVFMGMVLGVLVTLSSVGAGALGTAILLLIYPALVSVRVVGTELAHAVPLTLVAGIGHTLLGNVDFNLLGALMIGSLPAIYVGTKVGKYMPENIMRMILAAILLVLGIRYLM
ncbi:sulfite exporter TauE/SafE family protein [Endozoicomonas sp. 8E]|uniref:sulfite exporter TauE/SafE family protein n=1 Tax=Endozoicomonas sp. 8E TaxID=3035692 RepID=UPI0029394C52|nr:sulfite exporter TauE/SafE family protein [Endozoicomonas sp. 8E]WOG25430.1 sulfite exporter TauE/SafE family protein [Endozoicomonas sp. 8E]